MVAATLCRPSSAEQLAAAHPTLTTLPLLSQGPPPPAAAAATLAEVMRVLVRRVGEGTEYAWAPQAAQLLWHCLDLGSGPSEQVLVV